MTRADGQRWAGPLLRAAELLRLRPGAAETRHALRQVTVAARLLDSQPVPGKAIRELAETADQLAGDEAGIETLTDLVIRGGGADGDRERAGILVREAFETLRLAKRGLADVAPPRRGRSRDEATRAAIELLARLFDDRRGTGAAGQHFRPNHGRETAQDAADGDFWYLVKAILGERSHSERGLANATEAVLKQRSRGKSQRA